MRVPDIIMKKRDGHELSSDEISFLIDGMVSGDVPDYQMSSFCMAVYVSGHDAPPRDDCPDPGHDKVR